MVAVPYLAMASITGSGGWFWQCPSPVLILMWVWQSQFPTLTWCMSWVWQVWCWHCQCYCLYLHDNHTSLPSPGACHGSDRCGADTVSVTVFIFMTITLPYLALARVMGPAGPVLTNSLAHFSRASAMSSWSLFMMLFSVRKCFSSRLISGMGNLSYTTCFSATTISLWKRNGWSHDVSIVKGETRLKQKTWGSSMLQ